jgi:hypothetical protein
MTDDLVARLRGGPTLDSCDAFDLVRDAADRIEELEKLNEGLMATVLEYKQQVDDMEAALREKHE